MNSDAPKTTDPDAALKDALHRMLALLECAPQDHRKQSWQDAWQQAQNAMLGELQDYA